MEAISLPGKVVNFLSFPLAFFGMSSGALDLLLIIPWEMGVKPSWNALNGTSYVEYHLRRVIFPHCHQFDSRQSVASFFVCLRVYKMVSNSCQLRGQLDSVWQAFKGIRSHRQVRASQCHAIGCFFCVCVCCVRVPLCGCCFKGSQQEATHFAGFPFDKKPFHVLSPSKGSPLVSTLGCLSFSQEGEVCPATPLNCCDRPDNLAIEQVGA